VFENILQHLVSRTVFKCILAVILASIICIYTVVTLQMLERFNDSGLELDEDCAYWWYCREYLCGVYSGVAGIRGVSFYHAP
jgi:hypothetical protein